MSKDTHVIEGNWYRLDSPQREICCDCNLTHVTEYQLYQGKLMMRTKVDRRDTNRRRKEDGIKVVKSNVSRKS